MMVEEGVEGWGLPFTQRLALWSMNLLNPPTASTSIPVVAAAALSTCSDAGRWEAGSVLHSLLH
jgi:hypothetical protein